MSQKAYTTEQIIAYLETRIDEEQKQVDLFTDLANDCGPEKRLLRMRALTAAREHLGAAKHLQVLIYDLRSGGLDSYEY